MKIPNELRILDLTVGQLRELLSEATCYLGQVTPSGHDTIETMPIEELSKLTGWSKSCIYKKCSLRKIPHSKVGKELRFDMKEVNEWIKTQKRKTGDEVVMDFERRHKVVMKKVK